MAAAPAFAATPRVGVAQLSAANAGRDGTGTIATVLTAHATNGSKVNRIVVKAEADPVASLVILWLKLGGSWYLFKEISTSGDPAAGSTTVTAFEYELNVADRDWCLPAGSELGATLTVAPTTGKVNVFALAADF